MNVNEGNVVYDQTNDCNFFQSAVDTDSKSDSESLRTIRELNKVFANRLKDCEDSEKVSEEKLMILQQWVDSLTEQNVMLIGVVETFEKEALLQLKVGFESQKLQNKELQVLQQQMTCKNRIIEAQQKALQKLNFPVKRLVEHDNTNKNNTKSPLNGDSSNHKEDNRIPNSMETCNIDKVAQACSLELGSTKKQLENVEQEKEVLRKNLTDVEKKIDKLNQEMISNEKNAREMRAALTAEVAEKHDQVLALRRETQHLEDRLRQADMQTHFKDDIIKELRKEIKIASNKLIGQLRDKDVAVSNLEEKLKIFKELPIEVSAQLYRLKQRVSSLNELLAAAKHRNEPKNDLQLVLNSILFNLNEALLLVDGYRSDTGASTLKLDDRHHKSSSNISDHSQNQMPLTNLMNELQSFKKLLEDDKLGCKKLDDDIRTILSSLCNNNRPEKATMSNDLHSRLCALQNHLKKYQDSKEKVYHKICSLQSDEVPKEKGPTQQSKGTCNGRNSGGNNQIGTSSLQCEHSRDVTIKKLTNDLHELNCQLKSREQIITNQQETIDLLQSSLQMEQTEMECLKVEKEKADAQTQALQAKVLMLEAELKVVQDASSNNASIETVILSGEKVNSTSTASKAWAPWSGKQALPTHRHIHDV